MGGCVLHVLEFIYEAIGEFFDLVNIKVGRFLSEGDTLRCIQHKEKVDRTICSQNKTNKQTKMAVSKYHPWNNHKTAKWHLQSEICVCMTSKPEMHLRSIIHKSIKVMSAQAGLSLLQHWGSTFGHHDAA